jgi:hypothetical protein
MRSSRAFPLILGLVASQWFVAAAASLESIEPGRWSFTGRSIRDGVTREHPLREICLDAAKADDFPKRLTRAFATPQGSCESGDASAHPRGVSWPLRCSTVQPAAGHVSIQSDRPGSLNITIRASIVLAGKSHTLVRLVEGRRLGECRN